VPETLESPRTVATMWMLARWVLKEGVRCGSAGSEIGEVREEAAEAERPQGCVLPCSYVCR
jgi:hypothetical protein